MLNTLEGVVVMQIMCQVLIDVINRYVHIHCRRQARQAASLVLFSLMYMSSSGSICSLTFFVLFSR